MQAAEAITRLMVMSQQAVSDAEACIDIEDGSAEAEELRLDQLALAVADAMLNSMLPVARFRAFVEVLDLSNKKHPVGNVTAEYTVCAVSMEGIKSGLSGVSINDMQIRAMVFEQTSTGAHPVPGGGFQGFTKSSQYRLWYRSLSETTQDETVQ